MTDTLSVPPQTAPRAARFVMIAAGLYGAIGGGISLAGWALDHPRFTDWINNGISIQPNATICVFLSGVALLFLASGRLRPASALGAIVAAIGLATLFQWITHWDLGIDSFLLFGREWGRVGVVYPGRMGPPGSISWTLLGLAIVLTAAHSRTGRRVAATLALAALTIGFVSTTSYFYGASVLYTLPQATVIAFQTATFIVVVAVGAIAALTDRQPMRMLLERGTAGMFARRALPLLIFVPVLVGFVSVRAQNAGLFDTGFGSTLRTVIELGITLTVLWLILALVKRKEEAEHKNAERLQVLLAGITDAFYALGTDWRFGFVNDEMVRRFGVPREEIIGKSLWELFPKLVGTDAEQHLRRAMTERISADYETYDQQERLWFRSRVYPTTDGGLAVYSEDVTERKLSANAHARLAAIVESSDDAIVSKDLNGVIITWNRGAERLFGYTQDEAIGQSVAMLIPTDRVIEEPTILSRIRRGESIDHYETIRRRKDGTLVDVSVTVSPLMDQATGRIVGASKVARDITERRRIAESVRRSQLALSLLVQSAPFGIYVVDSDFKIAMLNRGSETGAFAHVRPAVGYDFAAAMRIIWPPETADSVLARFRHTLETGEPFRSKDFFHRRADIHKVEAYEWELHRITLPDGANAVVCYYYNSTNLREAEQAAWAARNELRQTLDTAAVGLVHVDRNYRYVAANPAYSEIAGLPVDQIIGRSLEEVMGPEGFALVRPHAEKALRGERAEYEIDIPWAAGGGKRVSVVHTPWLDPEGAVTGWVASVADVTARKLAEDELQRHQENLQRLVDERSAQLEESFRRLRAAERLGALGTLAAGLGHDISNLILPMKVRLECLQEADLSEQSREDVETLWASIGYLNQLSSSLRLLASSPVDAASHRARVETDLDRWCEMATPLFKAIAPRGCRAQCTTTTSGLVAAIDEARLLQVVFNLVQNAAEAIKEQPDFPKRSNRIDIQTRIDPGSPDASRILIEVSDTGPGMDDDVLRRCLEPYFTTKRKELSGGLGLALVRQYVEEVGGTISVRSRKGEGTTFSIVLPRAQPTLSVPTGATFSSDPANLRTAYVTVRDPRTAALLSWSLRAAGITPIDVSIENPPSAGLWIVEMEHKDAAVAYAKSSGRVALVIGPGAEHPDQSSSPYLIFSGSRPSTASLRRAMEVLLQSSQPQEDGIS